VSDRTPGYGQLLAKGHAFAPPDADMPAWRAAIREAARADKIRVRTGLAENGRAWAYNVTFGESAARAYEAYEAARGDTEATAAAALELRRLGLQTPEEAMEAVDEYMRSLEAP
jgi:hypothetical protein